MFGVSLEQGERGDSAGAQMATQVEALLPANSLLPSEEHGLVIKSQEKGERLMLQGEKANADEGKGGGPDSCSKEGGGGGGTSSGSSSSLGDLLRRNGALKPPSIKQQKEDSNNQAKENLLQQRNFVVAVEPSRLPGEPSSSGSSSGGEEGGVGRKEFIEAPPPKVNPWTKNAAPAALVTLNGQSPPGGSERGGAWEGDRGGVS